VVEAVVEVAVLVVEVAAGVEMVRMVGIPAGCRLYIPKIISLIITGGGKTGGDVRPLCLAKLSSIILSKIVRALTNVSFIETKSATKFTISALIHKEKERKR
jgi:hypothetical protein